MAAPPPPETEAQRERRIKLEDEHRRGKTAHRILHEPLLVEAFATIEQTYIEMWKSSKVGQEEGREKCWQMVASLIEFRQRLTTVMQTGKLAAIQLTDGGSQTSGSAGSHPAG